MTNDVNIRTLACGNHYTLGHIHLNKPKALNALSLDMAKAILAQLNLWSHDDSIACVLITGEGDRAFCAGGDIQAMYHAMQQNPGKAAPETEAFFTCEYHMDYALHQFNKPLIAWGHGVVMGGGMGIFMGCDFRVVSASSRLAMPEITIGLYPDVGASYFLNKLPNNVGRFLALTGAITNATDSLNLHLATHHCPHSQRDALITQLCDTHWSGERDNDSIRIEALLTNLCDEVPEPLPLSQLQDCEAVISTLFTEEDSHALIDAFLLLEIDNPWLQHAQANLRNGSPLSALIIDEKMKRMRGKDLATVFKSELVLSTNIVRFTELAEGIRALLIDKDKSPKWAYKTHRDIPREVVEGFFIPPWTKNPLDDVFA